MKQTGCPNPNVDIRWMDHFAESKDDYIFSDIMAYCKKTRDGTAANHHKHRCCSSLLCLPTKCTLQNEWASGK